ncbi:MAG: hypothetical protein J2P17_31150, partial [Mycobacterium sp.]|nr:hypothetical protein [Mycobacterium sp.]
ASHEADMSARSARKVGIVAAHGGKHYDYGQHAGSLGSIGSRVQADYKVRADDVVFTVTVAADLAVKFAEYLGTLN